MNNHHSKKFFVVPVCRAAVLTSVALGLVRALQSIGVEVRFAKPINEDTPDKSSYFAQQIFQIPVPAALKLSDVAERMAANQAGEVLEEIVGMCIKTCPRGHVMIIEGLHIDDSHPFVSQLNIDIARSLNAEVVLVADASTATMLKDARLMISQFQNAGQNIAGIILNKTP